MDIENVEMHITGEDFNALYPSVYSSIYNEMIRYMGNKMLVPGKFKDYTVDKEQIMRIINEKKELFVVTMKGGITEEKWEELHPNYQNH
jgi:hypothetical protein